MYGLTGLRYPRWGRRRNAVRLEKGWGVGKGLEMPQNPQRRVHPRKMAGHHFPRKDMGMSWELANYGRAPSFFIQETVQQRQVQVYNDYGWMAQARTTHWRWPFRKVSRWELWDAAWRFIHWRRADLFFCP